MEEGFLRNLPKNGWHAVKMKCLQASFPDRYLKWQPDIRQNQTDGGEKEALMRMATWLQRPGALLMLNFDELTLQQNSKINCISNSSQNANQKKNYKHRWNINYCQISSPAIHLYARDAQKHNSLWSLELLNSECFSWYKKHLEASSAY